MEDSEEIERGTTAFTAGQVCIAAENFDGTEPGDLSFTIGEHITIIRPLDVMYWYIGKNSQGKTGAVPGNYLDLLSDVTAPPALPPKPRKLKEASPDTDEYEKMGPGGPAPILPPKAQKKAKPMTEEEREMMRIFEREKRKRYAKGTLVVATATFRAEKPKDMSFKVHEELILLKPMEDYCWYYAQKVDSPSHKGVIPITHVRLVYMSDEEDDGDQIYNKPKTPGHDRLYHDMNEFITSSGWFTCPGVLGKEAQLNVMAKKAGMNYQTFMDIKKAIYVLSYREEKVYVGRADVLHEELMKHFDCFGKKRHEIREVDDELCHHTDSLGWNLKVYQLPDEANLEVEWAKKVIEHDSLVSTDGIGINEHMSFTSRDNFNNFWEWLSPN